eukprot:TRINITY_DN47459_c0_g1_i1.p1 TRINITY_DN47459_c0_g1~~TRINITY_DN47459_c0_g1_i1.p1  ORF type:complete len:293 (+),score=56.57 TRINITY_DN47459_c0_g1_i1:78-881(+)
MLPGASAGLPSDFGRGAATVRRCPLCSFSVQGRSQDGSPCGGCCWKCVNPVAGSWIQRSPPSWLLPKVLAEAVASVVQDGGAEEAVGDAVRRMVAAVNSADTGVMPPKWRVADVQGTELELAADVYALREARLNSAVRVLYVRVPREAADAAVRRGRLPKCTIDLNAGALRLYAEPPQGAGRLLRCYVRAGVTRQEARPGDVRCPPLSAATLVTGPHSWSSGGCWFIPAQQQIALVQAVPERSAMAFWMLLAFIISVAAAVVYLSVL